MMQVRGTIRGVEHATRRSGEDGLVPMKVNGRTEMLPADPYKTSAILRERHKQTPAAKARAKMAAAAKARGI